MEMIDEAKGFRLIFVLLPSLDVDEFDKYEDFYEPQTIIAAAECLAMIVENTKVNKPIIISTIDNIVCV